MIHQITGDFAGWHSKMDLGLATHAIGDAAIEFVVEVYTRFYRDFPNSIRRIEHLGLPEEQHLQDMAKAGISASMQAIFISELGKNFIRYLDAAYLSVATRFGPYWTMGY